MQKNKLLLGICGSISAYKAPLIVREFIKLGYEVRCVITETSKQFVSPVVLSNLTHFHTIQDMFDPQYQNDGSWHIHLAHWADCMLIAPCTATTLSKVSNGSADSALLLVALSLLKTTPLFIAPAMDTDMWNHPSTQRNIRVVQHDGAVIIPPEEGELASGLVGIGRLPEPTTIVQTVHSFLSKNTTFEIENQNTVIEPIFTSIEKDKWHAELELELLKQSTNKVTATTNDFSTETILITAGPTQEPIDDVRYITNHSSGKMGYALAEVAVNLGAKVILISGPVSLEVPNGVVVHNVTTSKEMFEMTTKYQHTYSIGIMAAAVSDFTPEMPVIGKIKKDQTGDDLKVTLRKTDDILKHFGEAKKANQFLVGFSLESEQLQLNAFKKLSSKKADMIVGNYANKPKSGFNGDENTVSMFYSNGVMEELDPMSKKECAIEIFKRIALYKKFLQNG